ncbi:MAG: hypothetical protein ABIJ18_03015, partial [archaeon]
VANNIVWYVNGILNTTFANESWIESANTSKNDRYNATISLYDGNDWSSPSDNASIDIFAIPLGNTAPSIDSVIFNSTSTANYSNGTLQLSWVQSDADLDTITNNETKWALDGVENSTFANNTNIRAVNIIKGEVWSVSVRVYDGTDWSSWSSNASITIINDIPDFISLNLKSDSSGNYTGNDVYINWTFIDADSDVAVDNETRWYVNGTYRVDWINETRINKNNFTTGDVLNVSAKIYDGTDWSDWSANESITIVAQPSTPVTPVSPGGGGGGGGGGGFGGTQIEEEEISEQIIVDKIIEVDMTINEAQKTSITVVNPLDTEQVVTLSTVGLNGYISFEDNNFILQPGESRTIIIYVVSSDETGTFSGEIFAKLGGISQSVPFILGIETLHVLFDARIDLQDTGMVSSGSILPSQITVFSVGSPRKVDVVLNYYLKDMNNNIIWGDSETIAVEDQVSFRKDFKLPNEMDSGKYVMVLDVVYKTSVATSSAMFEVGGIRGLLDYDNNRVIISVMIIVIILLMMVMLLFRRYVINKNG